MSQQFVNNFAPFVLLAIDKNIAMNMMEENKNYLTFTFLVLENLFITLGKFIFKCIIVKL